MARSLLHLPAEIVQHVLYLLDPSTFYICLLTHRMLRQHAMQSKKLLIHQIAQVPGVRSISLLTRKDASELLLMFNKRAAKHLFNGVSRMASIHLWNATSTMNRSLSNMFPWHDEYPCKSCTNKKRPRRRPLRNYVFLEVHARDAVLRIHRLERSDSGNGQLATLHTIPPEILLGYLPSTAANSHAERHEIIQIAWQSGCPSPQCNSTPTLLLLLGCSPLRDLQLVTIDLDPQFGLIIQSRCAVDAPLNAVAVTALAVDSEGDPTVLWELPLPYQDLMLVKYNHVSISDGVQHLNQASEALITTRVFLPDWISRVDVHADRAIIFPRSLPMPFWIADNLPITLLSQLRLIREETSLPAVGSVHTSRQGIFLAQLHIHRSVNPLSNLNEPCANGVLKLFISRDRHHGGPMSPARQGVYVVRTIQYPSRCAKFDPRADNGPLLYDFVACLADTPSLENLPSIGLKVAVSPRSYRIALAAWRTVRIYSIDPKVFLSHDRSSYRSNANNAYTYCNPSSHTWRSGYYNNWPQDENQVILVPVEVPSSGVIHALYWTSEDILWALTDEGICRWNIGVWANAQQTQSDLDCCVSDLKLARGMRPG